MPVLVSKNTPRQVVIKSRGRIGGKKASYDEIEQQIVQLAKDGKTTTEIQHITGKDRTTVWRYIDRAVKKGLVNRTSRNKIEITKQVETQIAYDYLQKDLFKEKYPAVKTWVEKRLKEAAGDKKKITAVKTQLNRLKIICDTLELNPYALLTEKNGIKYAGLEDAMLEFKMHIVNDTVKTTRKKKQRTEEDEEPNIDSIFRNYLIPVRNFVMYNGVSIPKLPKEHILSGKKVSFGMYAHVKLPFAKIDEIVQYLKMQYGEKSRELAAFLFYYMTGTRRGSLYKIMTSTVQQRLDGWLECRVYESKTRMEWRKLIPNDNPHFELLKNYMLERVRQGKKYIFIDSENESQKLGYDLSAVFKQAYTATKVTEPYFFKRPTHGLRHVAAHYWLDRTGLNYVVVAYIVGWKDVQTLISCYGGVTDDQILSIVARSSYKHG